ncbi:hypothetical protein JTB14_024872 [Gonioctena quinquepunctata]|nr:hypothetical protein JTB14_024872 [Gonioctena quinquepunctata]
MRGIENLLFGFVGYLYVIFRTGKQNLTGLIVAHTNITDGPGDCEVEASNPVTFRCDAVADESLHLEILWLKNSQLIDFVGQPRFIKSSNYSLTITKTIALDSGTYTCLARTELDEASAKAQLTVRDVPNSPRMAGVKCHPKDATISWTPMGDNHAPIRYFIVQYNTSFTPEEWDDAFNHVPSTDMTFNVPISPWANYSFRVIAVNKMGPSTPSSHSDVCTTSPEVPSKNPDNVKGEGDRPDNLVITWTPMPQIHHHAPGFKYWKKDIAGNDYDYKEILDYEQNRSEEAPFNFTLINIQGPTTALLSWDPVPVESVRGHFKGYKIKTWSDSSSISKEIQVHGGNLEALVTDFEPYTRNYAEVYVFNGRYDGPPSERLSFDTPEGIPGKIQEFDGISIGPSAFFLLWTKPDKPNGILTGYNIYFTEVKPSLAVNQSIPRRKRITDPNRKFVELDGLKPGTKYRIFISATTNAGESIRHFIERDTEPAGPHNFSKPSFTWEIVKPGHPTTVKVRCFPDEYGNTGSHFFVKYKKKGKSYYMTTDPENSEDFLEVHDLDGEAVYDFIVTSVDGQYYRDSDVQEVNTFDIDGQIIRANGNVGTAGWLIGMMVAIAFLLLVIILVVLIIKMNQRGKYAVHEKKQADCCLDYSDEDVFHEYSQPQNRKHLILEYASLPIIFVMYFSATRELNILKELSKGLAEVWGIF